MAKSEVKFVNNTLRAKKAIHEEGKKAVHDILLDVQSKAKTRAPKDTGALRASHNVRFQEGGYGSYEGTIGSALPYSVEQHENVTLNHQDGEAKWLEKIYLENIRKYEERMARGMEKVS